MGPKAKNFAKNEKKRFQKEEKASRNINQRKKDSYLADDDNFHKFSQQLAKFGLELRDITGDGNCLFRALSDQMEGNETNHLTYRRQVCEYMRKNRDDFEPFVVGLIEEIENKKKGRGGNASAANSNMDPFERYVSNLETPGSYGGNDALVAFARLHQLEICVHQLDQPVWRVSGVPDNARYFRQLHLSYHNGEHYSSIRQLGDLTNNPTNIRIDSYERPQASNNNDSKSTKKNKNPYEYNYDNYNGYENDAFNENEIENIDNLNDNATASGFAAAAASIDTYNDTRSNTNDGIIDRIIDITSCYDVNLIKEVLNENSNNVDTTITQLLSILSLKDVQKPDGIEYDSDNENENENNPSKGGKFQKKLSSREKKQLKKQRQMDRQRLKVVEEKEKENFKHSSNAIKNDDNDARPAGVVVNENNNNEEFKISLSNVEATSI